MNSPAPPGPYVPEFTRGQSLGIQYWHIGGTHPVLEGDSTHRQPVEQADRHALANAAWA
jgi:hypothetical protein